MASSSVSQDSLDINDDYELNARRTRIRTQRARGALYRVPGDRDSETSGDRDSWDINGSDVTTTPITVGVDVVDQHDSPTRMSAAQRLKDKRNRPNHLQKGKGIKDKRKLREKRRSTGVAKLPSTESTGDSLDDDEDGEKVVTSEAKRNTAYNEVIDADNPQTPSEVMRRIRQFQTLTLDGGRTEPPVVTRGFAARRNKSPSDLEADLEDNQDYDSTVSQSDSNLALIDQSTARDPYQPPQVPSRSYKQSKYGGSESTQSFKPYVSQQREQTYRPVSAPSASQNSVLSKYRTDNTYKESDLNNKSTSQPPSSPRSPKQTSTINQTTNVPPEPTRVVSSVLARYGAQEKPEESVGYRSRFRDREYGGVRGPIGQQFASTLMNKENREDDITRRKLEKDFERERDENKRLQKVVEEKDRRIAELERLVAGMNRDIEDFEDENAKLQIENRALIQAVGQLSTNV